jgi:hypothetical protein
MMRFRGGGIGHKSTREATNLFKKDRDQLDTLARSAVGNVEDDEVMSEEELELELDEEDDGDEDEDDYGYANSQSDEDEVEGLGDDENEDDEDKNDFGPEDDGGAVDPDMDELGYADL